MNLDHLLTDAQAKKLGDAVIALFDLRIKPNGRINSAWGDKTPIGLGHTIARLMDESK